MRRVTKLPAVKPATGGLDGDAYADGEPDGLAPEAARGTDEMPRSCEPGLSVVGFQSATDHVPVPDVAGAVLTVSAYTFVAAIEAVAVVTYR